MKNSPRRPSRFHAHHPDGPRTIVHADINAPETRVGYISAESDLFRRPAAAAFPSIYSTPTPQLRRALGSLIVVGVRASNFVPNWPAPQTFTRLCSAAAHRAIQPRLYLGKFLPAYHATIGAHAANHRRTFPVFLKPDDAPQPPNKITRRFRQLGRSAAFTLVRLIPNIRRCLMNDPGESDLKGRARVHRYGKGTYIYTGLASRQLPGGVPGNSPFREFSPL